MGSIEYRKVTSVLSELYKKARLVPLRYDAEARAVCEMNPIHKLP